MLLLQTRLSGSYLIMHSRVCMTASDELHRGLRGRTETYQKLLLLFMEWDLGHCSCTTRMSSFDRHRAIESQIWRREMSQHLIVHALLPVGIQTIGFWLYPAAPLRGKGE